MKILLSLLLSFFSYSTFGQDLLYYKKYDSYSYTVYSDEGSDHYHKAIFYNYINQNDSILNETWEGYFNEENKRFNKNGKSITFDDNGHVSKEEYYLMGDKHGVFKNEGKEYFSGYEINRIPLIECKTISKKHSTRRAAYEDSMFNKPSIVKGYTYSPNRNAVIESNKENFETPYLNWWWPVQLKNRDENHTIIGGIDFTFDFTPYASDDHTPINILLGNGPAGYYYIQIGNDGTTYLGESTSEGDRIAIHVKIATQIKWGEKNHLNLQVLDNGVWYIEINNYKQSFEALKFEYDLKNSTNRVDLSPRLGRSNRVQLATRIDIHTFSLYQLELINNDKETHPYNGLHKNQLNQLQDIIIEKIVADGNQGKIMKSTNYMTSFYDEADVLKTLVDVSYQGETSETLSNTFVLIEYHFDEETNSITGVTIHTPSNSIILTAQEFYREYLNGDYNYKLINGLIQHPNSRAN